MAAYRFITEIVGGSRAHAENFVSTDGKGMPHGMYGQRIVR
ncbi:Uncharacterised protein [Mycobacteroides abscessus subsp. bolletii]|nr:Uncharacterised protein [Mycobacteroides abscessus subsp. bolletii]